MTKALQGIQESLASEPFTNCGYAIVLQDHIDQINAALAKHIRKLQPDEAKRYLEQCEKLWQQLGHSGCLMQNYTSTQDPEAARAVNLLSLLFIEATMIPRTGPGSYLLCDHIIEAIDDILYNRDLLKNGEPLRMEDFHRDFRDYEHSLSMAKASFSIGTRTT